MLVSEKPLSPAAIDMLDALLDGRSSCRGFLDTRVNDETLEHLLRTAQRTASWCNSQPWQLIVTRGDGTERFRAALHRQASSGAKGAPDFPFPREYKDEYLQRRRNAGFALYEAVGVGRGDDAGRVRQSLENFRFFGAPHVAIVTAPEALGVYGAVDCGGYVQNFVLAAHALGLGAIPQAALALHSEFVRGHFGIADDRRVVCGISFGYADRDHPANGFRTDRAAIEDVVTWVD